MRRSYDARMDDPIINSLTKLTCSWVIIFLPCLPDATWWQDSKFLEFRILERLKLVSMQFRSVAYIWDKPNTHDIGICAISSETRNDDSVVTLMPNDVPIVTQTEPCVALLHFLFSNRLTVVCSSKRPCRIEQSFPMIKFFPKVNERRRLRSKK